MTQDTEYYITIIDVSYYINDKKTIWLEDSEAVLESVRYGNYILEQESSLVGAEGNFHFYKSILINNSVSWDS